MFWFIVILRYNKNNSRKTKIVIYSGEMNMDKDPFKEYLRESEPNKATKGYVWSTAVGLQAVDGLKPSQYLIDTAIQNIEGKITLKEAQSLIESYYNERPVRVSDNERTEEADKVSANIKKILSSKTLAFNVNGFISMHRRIFEGVFKHAGEIRKYDITKKEWVLKGDTVHYLNWEDIHAAIDYDIRQEQEFSYKGLSDKEKIKHISRFVSGLWQIHPFREGNTRTTAVFTIQYLRSIGYEVNNDLFADHSWYFRNALVRANYKSSALGIDYDYSFLEKFFQNLLLGEHYDLKNRYLIINAPDNWNIENDTQELQNDTQDDTQGLQNDTQEYVIPGKKELDGWIEKQIRKDPKISTGQLARMSQRSVITIKRHISRLGHIKFVGSGFSGHWEISEE